MKAKFTKNGKVKVKMSKEQAEVLRILCCLMQHSDIHALSKKYEPIHEGNTGSVVDELWLALDNIEEVDDEY